MSKIKSVITNFDLISAFGRGLQPLWDGLMAKQSAIKTLSRFSTREFSCKSAALIKGLNYHCGESLVMQMLTPIIRENISCIPVDARLILATTVGEIDLLEKDLLDSKKGVEKINPGEFLKKIEKLAGLKKPGFLVSCACASASSAIAQGASLIREGLEDCVLVVAADGVSEFVFSGFSALMALDQGRARPFDKKRSGLSLGEAAGFILLMSEERAEKERRKIEGEVSGWALSSDANHMTGPSRDAAGLKRALLKALQSAGISASEIGCISAHGTGTLYNDAMELKAFKDVFTSSPVPVYSIKGATGHTLGGAGLLETIVLLRVLNQRVVPATVGLEDIDVEAQGWVDLSLRELKKNIALLNNCGFGGINSVLILSRAGAIEAYR